MKSLRNLMIVTVLAALVMGAVALALPASPVYAQTTNPPAQKPGNGAANAAARLEKAFQNEQTWLKGQAALLSKGGEMIQKAEALIARRKANGKDTTRLEKALALFKTALGNAQAAHDKAAATLAAHPGFDAAGKVTDAKTALATVKSARADLRDARQIIQKAIRVLRLASGQRNPAGIKPDA